MGNSTQTKSKNVTDNYMFVKSIAEGKCIYTHKVTGKEYVSLERTFPTSQMLLEYEHKMRKLLTVTHPYFLNQTQHAMLTTSTLCSMQYRVIHYFQHEPHTLQQQLQTRKAHQKPFEQKQVWSILCGAVLALAYLTKQDILCYPLHPRNIVIDKLGMIRILSPLLTDNGIQLVQQGFYYSPQHMKAFKTSNFSTLTNKTSVFTLGITLLHILSLEPMNELYDYEKCTVDMEMLATLIDQVTQREIKSVLRKMLKYHTYERITFTELEEMLFDILERPEGEEMGGGGSAYEYGNEYGNEYAHEQEGSRERLSVHKQAYQSAQYEMQSNGFRNHSMQASQHLMNYSTGNYPINCNLQPYSADHQDRPHLFISDSTIDYPIVDEKDIVTQNYDNRDRLESSRLFQNKSSIMMMKASNFYDANNSIGSTRTALREMSNSSHNNMNFINNNTPSFQQQKQSLLKPQSKAQESTLDTEQTTRPIHVREELNIGTYQGYKLNNFRHGYGVFYYTQGGKYVGEWYRNKMQGRGALYYANDQIAYQGEWLNDKLHGFGILYNQTPSFMPHPFDFKSLHLVDNFWTKYEGNFYEDEKYGEGTLFLSNNEYYRGFFKEGLPHGNGVFRTVNNDIVRGNWVLGVMQ